MSFLTNLNKEQKVGLLVGLLIILGLISMAFGSEGVTSTQQESQVETQPVSETKAVPESEVVARFALLSGVERDPSSDAYGELVVSEINVWSDYGNRVAKKAKVNGTVAHGTKVKILEETFDDYNEYVVYKIETPDGVIGWVSELFVEGVEEL